MAGFKNAIDMGNYICSAKEQEAYMWCIRNNIYISPKALSTTEWFLCIVINGNSNISPNAYKKIDIWKQLYKFYSYYYDKYAIKVKVETVKEPTDKLTKKQQAINSNNNLKLF